MGPRGRGTTHCSRNSCIQDLGGVAVSSLGGDGKLTRGTQGTGGLAPLLQCCLGFPGIISQVILTDMPRHYSQVIKVSKIYEVPTPGMLLHAFHVSNHLIVTD